MENKRPTQCDRIIDYIEEFGSITQLEAIKDLGIMRLASRVSEMRKRGIPITSKMEEGKNRWGEKINYKRYYLED